MEPRIDHIEITVKNMDTAVPFYDRFLPLLGFDLSRQSSVLIDTPLGTCDRDLGKIDGAQRL